MSLHSWLRKLRSALAPRRDQLPDKRRGKPRAGTHRPSVEVLEDRLTPSLYVGDYDPWVEWEPPPPYRADFTSDGIIDLFTLGAGGVLVHPGRSDGTYGDPIPTDANVGVLAVAEFNGDARHGLVTANSDWEGTGAYVNVLLGRGDGTFQWVEGHYIYGLGFPTQIGLAQNGLRVTIAGYNEHQTEYVAWTLHNDGNWPTLSRTLRIGDVTVAESHSGHVAATFTVTLTPGSTEPVTVSYSTGNGTATAVSDYQAASGVLTFAPGEMSKTVTVLVNGDRLAEPNETFTLNLSSPTGATLAAGQAVGTIVDDEPRISISDVTKSEGKKGKTTLFTFTVTLSTAYDQPVTMSFATANGTARTSDNDYVAKSGTLTFAPGETTKTVTIEVKGDSKREDNEHFYLDLFDNSTHSLLAKSRGVGTILTDD